MLAQEEKSEVTKFSRIPHLGTMNARTKCLAIHPKVFEVNPYCYAY